MRTLLLGLTSTCLFFGTAMAWADPDTDIDALRAELEQIRADYESRIAELEKRLDAAERKAEERAVPIAPATEQAPTTSEAWPAPGPVAQTAMPGSGMFNPDIGVIFQGQTWSYDNDPDDYSIPGFTLAGEAGPAPEGLSLGETEINISGNVDDKFTAWLTVPLHYHDGHTEIEIEEAWLETLKLPAGLALRMGRFYSNIGYLNGKHSHSWDFADQPLPYQALLGNQHLDDGLQLRWLAPTDFYLELGGELTRGERYPAGGAGNSGIGAYTLHARFGGDVGYSHSWQAGLSYLQADAEERAFGSGHDEHEEDHEGDMDHAEDPLYFTGQSDLLMAEFVWKWAPNGNWKQRNFVLQAEYLWRNEDGNYYPADGGALPYDVDQRGWYAQAVYQPFPQWRFGLRYDRLASDYPGDDFIGTALMPSREDPLRYSIMADWSNSEFSRLRMQYTLDQAGLNDDNQLGLQYIFSIGAHGAHTF